MKSSDEIRAGFLRYFAERGHEVVASSSLVPRNDPTLLFTNAGMVQFKEVFLGREVRSYTRAVSSQRCVRAGGKHNDLENVGYTARHHTFFEMLGNFSFGDYFKREAIDYAWEFLTRILKLPPERLWVTVFEDDEDAAEIWLANVGVDERRFSRCGEAANFWSMGDTGPCGPCTEIFYDHGPGIAGGPPGSPEEDGDRYVEIWNLVFMQYDRSAEGELTPMARTGVDTGMGLERIAAVMQGVHSNYETDLFIPLIEEVQRLLPSGAGDRGSLQAIADHIRSCSFLIDDGVMPSNEGAGYVLRRIIRRAARHGHALGLTEPFFHRLVAPLAATMKSAYPDLQAHAERIADVLKHEEERFAETLDQGLRILEQAVEELAGTEIPGSTVFQLYDTYGFPVDLTADIARGRGLTLDMEGFEREMAAQRERARQARHFAAATGVGDIPGEVLARLGERFAFVGYDASSARAQVLGIFRDGAPVEQIGPGEDAAVVLACTPFYAESGGQVGDQGTLRGANGVFTVLDTQKQGGVHLHIGNLKLGSLRVGEAVEAEIDGQRREPTRGNHSATHLLHAALRKVLGEHVTQKGSLVAPDRLRFDFSHPRPLTPAELETIETLVNAEIRRNTEVRTRVMPVRQALESGAVALFGEKYEDEVRVLSMGGDFSIELCGGTHVRRTGDIGLFKIVSEGGVAAGIRRIEAITGAAAFDWWRESEQTLAEICALVKGSRDTVRERVGQLAERARQLERELEKLGERLTRQQGTDLASQAVELSGVKLLAARVETADPSALRNTADELKSKLEPGVVVLGAADEDKVRLVATVSKKLVERIKAGELVNHVAKQVGGKGGGRPDMAQAGGSEPENLDAALASVRGWVETKLS